MWKNFIKFKKIPSLDNNSEFQVRKKYFLNIDMESEDEFRPRYVQFLTDLLITRCTDRFIRLLANQGRAPDWSADLAQPMRAPVLA